MKEIPLTKGMVALVDDCDYDKVKDRRWHISGSGYVCTWIKGKKITLHRFIMMPPDDKVVDHANHDKLDCTRGNLRICESRQNTQNSKCRKDSQTHYKGVFPKCGRFAAAILGKYLGTFDTIEEAALAYNYQAAQIYGEFAYLNKVEFNMAEMLTKTEASIYILGYEDRKFINDLLKSKQIGVRLINGVKTKKIIYKKDIDKFLENLPTYVG